VDNGASPNQSKLIYTMASSNTTSTTAKKKKKKRMGLF